MTSTSEPSVRTPDLSVRTPGRSVPLPSPPGGALSPSRASDFMQCPLLYRFRVLDKLPEAPRPAAVRGTVVHSVLERLFDLPAERRTPQAARELLPSQWERVRRERPETEELFDGDQEELARWLEGIEELVLRWFELEDPTRLEPADRELYVQAALDDGPVLRGYVDRVDVAPDGRVRVVDYKTGKAPRQAGEAKALFQMKFYALVLWRMRGTPPAMLQLVYLGDGQILRYVPQEAELVATERKIRALWAAMERARQEGDWRPSPSRLCDWCDHRGLCPAWGGTPPPLPDPRPSPDPAPNADPAPSAGADPGSTGAGSAGAGSAAREGTPQI
jgi:putative RecB family exonuclease